MASSSRCPLLDCGSRAWPRATCSPERQAHGSARTLVYARKKSGFAELLLQKRQGEQPHGKHLKLKPGRVSPPLSVPADIPRPPYVGSAAAPAFNMEPQVHDESGVARMRAAGELAARVRDFAGSLIKPGVTTDEIDKAVHKMIVEAGAYPSPLGYGGFPKSVCTSVNECICHGIPDSRPLQDGDIINIDVTVYLNGYHGDTSATFLCGTVSDEAKRLVEVTREALDKAIAVCGPGVEFKKIGRTIHDVADKFKYGVVKRFVGHGIGTIFHCAPSILHFRNNEPGRMQIGQTFTIEPMLTMGKPDDLIWPDNWTAVTVDGSLSAQFEHTLLVTGDGVQVLTRAP
ncbi:hypothetical protein SELMODRAFT_154620 [Selaginella moellendorffii]|uniref:Methionine aminopeptidase n=1 Tax=Selaginella moellendorffii TaxID=88036 RepID=D8SE44_SELML|nr:methionine aminopeptidase 1D, chloroplastic/mitochondrial [Selaginella moellendorffii]EFJ17369.1 hypothetical protein SELMODRAFT_154620 [Selaginella moellendorffii]|eukprot:XP_002981554.1 methionine aminopeptidase 1D, chloroplastic/mitochondrial [Selaginella moellendorffii]